MTKIRVLDWMGGGPPGLVKPGDKVTFGGRSIADFAMVNASGRRNTHISGEAGTLEWTSTGAKLTNLSWTHGLIIREWGLSAANDRELGRCMHEDAPKASARLDEGLYWVRNGSALTRGGRLARPNDELSNWLLISVEPTSTPSKSTPPGAGTAPFPLTTPHLEPFTLTSTQWLHFAFIFSQFLTMPPRTHPVVLADQDIQAHFRVKSSARRSEIRRAAEKAGFAAFAVDEALLTWAVRGQHVTYAKLWEKLADQNFLNLRARFT